MHTLAKAAFALSLVAMVVGCGFAPERVAVHDPRIAPLWAAARAFDRTKFGFSPLPAAGSVEWEHGGRANYDAMLHIGGKTERTIAFRKTADGYRWIGEQETFRGPKIFETPDGDQHEEIVLNYDMEPVSGFPLNRLNIDFFGEDPRLEKPPGSLTLGEVQPILKQWGY